MEAVQMKMMTQTLRVCMRKGIECNWVQVIGCQASAVILTFTHTLLMINEFKYS